MQKIIDILAVYDSETILRNYPNASQDCSRPTGIAHNCLYLLANQQYVISGQATADLHIRALVADVIRIRSTDLAYNTVLPAVIYAVAGAEKVLSPVQAEIAKREIPVPAPPMGCPSPYTMEAVINSDCAATVVSHGDANCRLNFWILGSTAQRTFYYVDGLRITVS
jgi:hypothetical protein